jgi:hypothetical protein
MVEGYSKCTKVAFGLGLLFTAGLTMLYLNQSKILYLPQYPIQHARDNPYGYRSPLERGMKYQEVALKVSGPVPDS